MCCVCGGGESNPDLVGLCTDTNNGALNWADNGDCQFYNDEPSVCGLFDDDDFDSNSMCCDCGGGYTECRDTDVHEMWESLAFSC